MSEETITKAKLKLEKDMIFKCDMGEMALKDCYIDETNQKEADMWGPNPARLLGTALLGCLSASFIFCMRKRKLNIDDLKAEAEIVIGRNEKGFLRVTKININIDVNADMDNENLKKRMSQCLKEDKEGTRMFEHFCTITQSVISGIDVDVNVNVK